MSHGPTGLPGCVGPDMSSKTDPQYFLDLLKEINNNK